MPTSSSSKKKSTDTAIIIKHPRPIMPCPTIAILLMFLWQCGQTVASG